MSEQNAPGMDVGLNRLLGQLRRFSPPNAFQQVRHPDWNEAPVYVTDASEPILSLKREELDALSTAAIDLLRQCAVKTPNASVEPRSGQRENSNG